MLRKFFYSYSYSPLRNLYGPIPKILDKYVYFIKLKEAFSRHVCPLLGLGDLVSVDFFLCKSDLTSLHR